MKLWKKGGVTLMKVLRHLANQSFRRGTFTLNRHHKFYSSILPCDSRELQSVDNEMDGRVSILVLNNRCIIMASPGQSTN